VPDDLPYVWPVRSEQAIQAERRRVAAAVTGAERRARRAEDEDEARKPARARSRAARKGRPSPGSPLD
jgi:hypothetical protein